MSKRPKLFHETHDDGASAVVVAEIGLEIAIKERILETLESRLTWALLLQESLLTECIAGDELVSFKDIALDTLRTVEAPLDFLFSEETPPPYVFVPQAPIPGRKARKDKKSQAQAQKKRFLYLRSHDANDTQGFVLRCPNCLKSVFSNLQGLYNHARLSHKLEWGNHEECVRACAVATPLDTLELEDGVEVGNGMQPGVRSLFQMAVEGSRAPPMNYIYPSDPADPSEVAATGVHLTSTLGFHAETHALAPFLGKQAKRRAIKAWAEDDPVDVTTTDEGRPTWRMPYNQRSSKSTGDHGGDIAHDTLQDSVMSPCSEVVPPLSGSLHPISSSRFHISARIIVTDRSQRIIGDKPHSATHRWMLSVEAPSYSHDITTILMNMSVSAADLTHSFPAVETSNPPFLVSGTASHPFLARIELLFNPATGPRHKDGQKVVLEHWVELDLLGTGKSIASGEQQVVDVELDRSTTILPKKTGYPSIQARLHAEPEVQAMLGPEEGEGYERLLRSLLDRFPMSQQELKGRGSKVPYKLVATPNHFKSLVLGRRKAIEWGRSFAIHAAYQTARRDGVSTFGDLIPLTVLDVFRWLEDNGHFPRDASMHPPPPVENEQPSIPEVFCRVCGLTISSHPAFPSVKDPAAAEVQEHLSCEIVPSMFQTNTMPILNIGRVVVPFPQHYTHHLPSVTPDDSRTSCVIGVRRWSYVDTIHAVDPAFLAGVESILSPLKLPSFSRYTPAIPRVVPLPPLPLARLGDTSLDVNEHVAPIAVLALATRQFLKALIVGGMEVAKRDRDLASGGPLPNGRSRRPKQKRKLQVLTPNHVLNGMTSRTRSRVRNETASEVSVAIFSCLARLGIQPQGTVSQSVKSPIVTLTSPSVLMATNMVVASPAIVKLETPE